jgi:O-antigen/teichoic acid export membrane protein
MKKFQDFLFKNTTTKQTIAKNSLWLFLGDIFGRLLRMGLIVYAARTLGTSGWGVFSYATSIGILLMSLSDIGISGIITREASQKKEEYTTLISTALVIKAVLLVASIGLVLGISPLISHISQTHGIFLLIATISFFDTIRELGFSINRAFEKMEREMVVKTIMNVAILVLGIIFLKINLSPKSMALAYAVGSGIGAFIIIFMIRNETKQLIGTVDRKKVGTLLKTAWPFAVITLVAILLANVDTYMLGLWKDASEIGLYASVQRIYAFVAVIPSTIAVATFPLMSRLAHTDQDKFRLTLEKALGVLLAISVPIAVGGALMSRELVLMVFGQAYAAAAPVMLVMMLMVIAAFPLILLANAVFAYDRQRSLSGVYIAGMVANIGLNAILIPKFGALGAALATCISNIIMTGSVFIKVRRINPLSIVPTLRTLLVPLMILVLVVVGAEYLSLSPVVTIVLAALAYLLTLHVSKAPLVKDVRDIIKISPS